MLYNAQNNGIWRSVEDNVKHKYFWCCATPSITIFYVDKLGTYEMCIFRDIYNAWYNHLCCPEVKSVKDDFFYVESCSLLFYFKFDQMGMHKNFIFGMIERKKGWSLTSIISQRKISLSQTLLSSNNIILRFLITAHQV